jgi:hypothetical protein
MNLSVIVLGVALLVVLGAVVGLAGAAERHGLAGAWREIARERRRNWEDRRHNLEILEEIRKCETCPFRSKLGGDPGPG